MLITRTKPVLTAEGQRQELHQNLHSKIDALFKDFQQK